MEFQEFLNPYPDFRDPPEKLRKIPILTRAARKMFEHFSVFLHEFVRAARIFFEN